MKFSILTLFPESIRGYIESSMLARARKEGLISIEISDPRTFARDKHHTADGTPYGGGPGMVLMAEPLLRAWEHARKKETAKTKTIILSPGGARFNAKMARTWARTYGHIILIAGHYEGIDDRVRKATRAQEISIGDYILTGGELPAIVIADAVARHVPGMLGNRDSLEERRAASTRVYTRPEAITLKGKTYRVPKVLLSGDHKKIEQWRQTH